jgi:L-iditol 2-dehydrogenase
VQFFGTPPVPGAFCEWITTIPQNLLPVPDGVTLEDAAVMEPLGVAVHATNISRLRPGQQVGIFGAGPIGLLTLQMVRAGGGTPICVTELIPERISAARAMGADVVVHPEDEDAGAQIGALTGGLDLAFEAAGVAEAVNDAIGALRPGGQLVIIGIPAPGTTPIDFHTARRKELQVVFARRSNYEGHQCLRLLASGRVTTQGIVTHRFPLERLHDAFELVNDYRDGVVKAMIEVDSARHP